MGGSKDSHTVRYVKYVRKKKNKYHMLLLICGMYTWHKLSSEKKQTHGHGEHTCGCQG